MLEQTLALNGVVCTSRPDKNYVSGLMQKPSRYADGVDNIARDLRDTVLKHSVATEPRIMHGAYRAIPRFDPFATPLLGRRYPPK